MEFVEARVVKKILGRAVPVQSHQAENLVLVVEKIWAKMVVLVETHPVASLAPMVEQIWAEVALLV